MSDWVRILTNVREELELGDSARIPESAWPTIARRCGPREVADLKARLAEVDAAKREIPDWDGDASDDIWFAEQLSRGVLLLLGNSDRGSD